MGLLQAEGSEVSCMQGKQVPRERRDRLGKRRGGSRGAAQGSVSIVWGLFFKGGMEDRQVAYFVVGSSAGGRVNELLRRVKHELDFEVVWGGLRWGGEEE